jgi:hypothetical protein
MFRLSPLLLAVWAAAALAQQSPAGKPGSIFTCVVGGKKITSDRLIPDCPGEQRELNRDGSLRRIIPPNLSAEERAEAEARERQEAEARKARQEAVRRDRNLLQRYPNKASHDRAREAALEPVRRSLRLSEERLKLLDKERKPLLDEMEFYVGKPLPGKLKMAFDANDAAVDAQRALIANQQAELVRLNKLYDDELQRLKALWGGAAPGSLGPMPAEAAPSAPAASGTPTKARAK